MTITTFTNATTSDLALAVANAVTSNQNPDRAYAYATTLGALQGLCEFHLTEKQKVIFTEALNRLADAEVAKANQLETA
jgi:hypothetical protein